MSAWADMVSFSHTAVRELVLHTVVTILFAVLFDRVLGEPVALHPLVGFGRLASLVERFFHPELEQQRSELLLRVKGVLAVFVLVVPCAAAALAMRSLSGWGWIFDVALLYLGIGGRSLFLHGIAVQSALEEEDLALARKRVGMIVSRDTGELTASQVSTATIESILENGSDAVFAPIFWFVVLGAPGVVLYRLANTLDAMWGYRNDRYLYFGWAAAKLDDLLNYIPARLTALTYCLAGNARSGFACWREQGRLWYSPNAGPVMAAGSGALELKLGGPAFYHGSQKARPLLGAGRLPESSDISRALKLLARSVRLWLVVLFAGGICCA